MQTTTTEVLVPGQNGQIAPMFIQEIVLSERNLNDLFIRGGSLVKRMDDNLLLRVRIEPDDLHYGNVVENMLRA